MRTAICPYCGKPYETDLMEGSDGMCKSCFDKEMAKLNERRKEMIDKGLRRSIVLFKNERDFLTYQIEKEADSHVNASDIIRRGLCNLPEYREWELEMVRQEIKEREKNDTLSVSK